MTAEIGHFALILALLVALVQTVAPMWGAARGDRSLMGLGRAAAGLQAGLVGLSFSCLLAAFALPDFSVSLVAQHAHSTQPLAYRIGAAWGNHEGSMLLWVLILAVFGGGIALFGDTMRETLQARVLGVQGGIGVLFLAFLLFTSNPFARLFPAPADGAELNPLLQDPGLILHPPLLYVGYVGFSVAFAFAAAALIEGRADAAWARWVRPWVLLAWTALTAGIAMGSHWAYYELGWGGWWFWDPVENASLMPWLLGTALLHCVSVLERRGALISWTLLLAILTFTLSLIGTFLVRSGVLTSVHAFAVDPARGIFILAMLVGMTGAALGLFAWRAPAMRSGALFGAISRESGLTANNVLLASACATVFLGTFYPVIMEEATGEKISVGPPYYALTFAPIMAGLLFVLTAGPMLQWRRDTLPALWARVRRPALVAGAALAITLAVAGLRHTLVGIGFALAAWVVVGGFAILARRWRLGEASEGTVVRLMRNTPRAVWGMVLGHVGMGVLCAGVTAASAFSTDKVLMMRVGQSVPIGGAQVRLDAVGPVEGPNYSSLTAHFAVIRGSSAQFVTSERRLYPVSGTRTTEAGIVDGLWGNDYAAIGDPAANPADGLMVRLYHHPLVGWIWGGAMLMALGGVCSLSDRRYRVGARAPAKPALEPAAGALPPHAVPAE